MIPEWLIGLLGGGFGSGVLTWFASRNTDKANAIKANAEAESIAIDAARHIFEEYRSQIDRNERELEKLNERINRMSESNNLLLEQHTTLMAMYKNLVDQHSQLQKDHDKLKLHNEDLTLQLEYLIEKEKKRPATTQVGKGQKKG